jgi:hypothetical protein
MGISGKYLEVCAPSYFSVVFRGDRAISKGYCNVLSLFWEISWPVAHFVEAPHPIELERESWATVVVLAVI